MFATNAMHTGNAMSLRKHCSPAGDFADICAGQDLDARLPPVHQST
jgi:hypothetical protein